MTVDWKAELTFDEAGKTWPFVEDENANITGYGHQDRAEFAAAVNAYDAACNGEPYPDDEQWEAGDVGHGWAVPTTDANGEWLLHSTSKDTPDAFPITSIWGQR